MKACAFFMLLTAATACDDLSDDSSRPATSEGAAQNEPLLIVTSPNEVLYRDTCALAASFTTGAGEYEVLSVTSAASTTTLRLGIQRRWSAAPPETVEATLSTAELPRFALADAAAGDHLGLLLDEVFDGRANLLPPAVFAPAESGGYNNGQFFTRTVLDLAAIGDVMTSAYSALSAGNPCVDGVAPDLYAPQPEPSDENVPLEVVQPTPVPSE